MELTFPDKVGRDLEVAVLIHAKLAMCDAVDPAPVVLSAAQCDSVNRRFNEMFAPLESDLRSVGRGGKIKPFSVQDSGKLYGVPVTVLR